MYLYKDGMVAYADKDQLAAMLADGWSPDKPSDEVIPDDEIVEEETGTEDDNGTIEAPAVPSKIIPRKKK